MKRIYTFYKSINIFIYSYLPSLAIINKFWMTVNLNLASIFSFRCEGILYSACAPKIKDVYRQPQAPLALSIDSPAKISQRRPPGRPASVSLRNRWLPPRGRAPPVPPPSRRQKKQQLLLPPPPPPPRRRSSTGLRFPHNPFFYSLPRSMARFLWLCRSKLSS